MNGCATKMRRSLALGQKRILDTGDNMAMAPVKVQQEISLTQGLGVRRHRCQARAMGADLGQAPRRALVLVQALSLARGQTLDQAQALVPAMVQIQVQATDQAQAQVTDQAQVQATDQVQIPITDQAPNQALGQTQILSPSHGRMASHRVTALRSNPQQPAHGPNGAQDNQLLQAGQPPYHHRLPALAGVQHLSHQHQHQHRPRARGQALGTTLVLTRTQLVQW